jgi:hypothetical protein
MPSVGHVCRRKGRVRKGASGTASADVRIMRGRPRLSWPKRSMALWGLLIFLLTTRDIAAALTAARPGDDFCRRQFKGASVDTRAILF